MDIEVKLALIQKELSELRGEMRGEKALNAGPLIEAIAESVALILTLVTGGQVQADLPALGERLGVKTRVQEIVFPRGGRIGSN